MLLDVLVIALVLLAVAAVLTLPTFSACSIESAGLGSQRTVRLSAAALAALPAGVACRIEVVYRKGADLALVQSEVFDPATSDNPIVVLDDSAAVARFSLFVVEFGSNRLLLPDIHATVPPPAPDATPPDPSLDDVTIEVGFDDDGEFSVVWPAAISSPLLISPLGDMESPPRVLIGLLPLDPPPASIPDFAQIDISFERLLPVEGRPGGTVSREFVFRHQMQLIDPPGHAPADSYSLHPDLFRVRAVRLWSGADLIAGPDVTGRCRTIVAGESNVLVADHPATADGAAGYLWLQWMPGEGVWTCT